MKNKTELINALVSQTGVGRREVVDVLDGLAKITGEELDAGRSIRIPGIVNLRWSVSPAKKKGERWKRGDTYDNRLTGEEGLVREADSPAVPLGIRLAISPLAKVNELRPKKGDADFPKSELGKRIVKEAKKR
jgi:nucleoid DNA-binding protein